MRAEPGVPRYATCRKAFARIFRAPPKERAMGVGDTLSYEELQGIFHAGRESQATLYGLVSAINDGSVHVDIADFLGDCALLGLEKPDGGTRPIAVGSALRRLAGRCIMEHRKEDIGRIFTHTPVPDDIRREAGLAPGAPCRVPLQLGCGTPGGAEIAIMAVRLHLERFPEHAFLSDDKVNGFNRITRKAIFRGLRRWFPELIPTVELWYGRAGGLFLHGEAATDGQTEPEQYYSYTGCQQGDSLAPLLWCVGYHETLLATQARHPTTLIIAYLDDTGDLDEPAEALAAMRTGERLSSELCGIVSNRAKQEAYSPSGDLSCLPSSLRGAPSAAPDASRGYAGGQLPGFKFLGSFMGEAEWCSAKLVGRAERALTAYENVPLLHDTATIKTALQCQLQLSRFCANTCYIYFMRTAPPSVSLAGAVRHDALVECHYRRILQDKAATAAEMEAAAMQMRLPVNLGGMGMTSMVDINSSAWVGSFALCWGALCRLAPVFADINLADSTLPSIVEFREAHASLRALHREVRGVYDAWGPASQIFGYDKAGEQLVRFLPSVRPSSRRYPPTYFRVSIVLQVPTKRTASLGLDRSSLEVGRLVQVAGPPSVAAGGGSRHRRLPAARWGLSQRHPISLLGALPYVAAPHHRPPPAWAAYPVRRGQAHQRRRRRL